MREIQQRSSASFLAGGPCKQFWHMGRDVQSLTLSIQHPLPTTASLTLQGALKDGFGEDLLLATFEVRPWTRLVTFMPFSSLTCWSCLLCIMFPLCAGVVWRMGLGVGWTLGMARSWLGQVLIPSF